MILYFIRHGERDTTRDYFNPALNHQDNPLTAKGRQQAERLGGYLSDKSIQRIIGCFYATSWGSRCFGVTDFASISAR